MLKTRFRRHESDAARSTARLSLRFTTFGVLVLAFGLLLWARFLLVTSHPRTAYADPAAADIAAGDAPVPASQRAISTAR